jgi:uncharacterized sporulation protein YeaH/YhbH (DUF444 family)
MEAKICNDVTFLSKQKLENICKILKNRIPPEDINKYCFESSDGTRIDLELLSELENYKSILQEIYNIVKL